MTRFNRNLLSCLCLVLLLIVAATAAENTPKGTDAVKNENTPAKVRLHCTFTKDGWNPADWLHVIRPDWRHFGKWIQGTDYIENDTPQGATADALQGDRAQETHASIVYHQPVQGSVEVTSTMSFAYRMAPLIVFGAAIRPSDRPDYQEYQDSYEIVLWDEGVNVWHQYSSEGKVRWDLIAYSKFPLKPNTRYTLHVRREGQTLHIRVDDHAFGVLAPALPASCYIGITGCEGINRFYDFSIEQ